jgi:hypothetical protein
MTSWDVLAAEALALVPAAAAEGVTLRVVGSAGIRLHCAGPAALMDALDRPAKDIDFVVPQGHRKGMRRLLEARGYVIDRDLLIAMEGRRYTFSHPGTGVDIDVFVERMEFCHTVEVAERMDTHPVTICPDDLLLQKLQVIRMTTTDLLDAGVLLATHRVAGAGPAGGGLAGPDDCAAEIDAPRIAALLARDWGFHHTATANLARVQGAAAVEPRFGADASARIDERAGLLLSAIDAEPKTRGWRLRDRIGERKQWWQDVDEKEATY